MSCKRKALKFNGGSQNLDLRARLGSKERSPRTLKQGFGYLIQIGPWGETFSVTI